MISMMPRKFTTTQNLDMEAVNDDLEAGARDVNRNLDKRYTYSMLTFHFDGVADTDAEALRRFPIRRPGTNNAVEIVGVELQMYAAGSVVWTIACSDVRWPSFTVTAAGATTEAYGSSFVPVSVPSSSTNLTFTISGAAASTITAGRLVVHLRCDRGNQGSSHAGYAPTLIDSASSTAGSLLDTELTALENAVARDTANDKDLRCEVFQVRNLASGSTRTVRLPSGARRKFFATGYVCAAVTETAAFAVDATTWNVTGIGATTLASGEPGTQISGSTNDDPMDSTDDTVVSIGASGGGIVLLAYVFVWWS